MPAGRRGFTLVELIVATAIFSVVITMVIGAFSMAIKAQKKVIALQNIQENAKFILEFLAKEVRMGTISTANGIRTNLVFIRSDETSITYVFTDGKITRNGVAMNADEVEIIGRFYINGVGPDNLQPKLTVVMQLKALGSEFEEETIINVESTLSQRVIDESDL